MSIFDSLVSSVVDLGDWVAGGAEDILDFADSDLGKYAMKGFNGLSKIMDSQNDRQASRLKYSNMSTEKGTRGVEGNEVDPRKADYGLANFAPDPAEIEARWHAILTKLVSPKDTMVKR